MTLGPLAFTVLVWGSLAAVIGVFGYLLRVVLREVGFRKDSSGQDSKRES
jgi:hypothetical protein